VRPPDKISFESPYPSFIVLMLHTVLYDDSDT
jgi:hypothetical protein